MILTRIFYYKTSNCKIYMMKGAAKNKRTLVVTLKTAFQNPGFCRVFECAVFMLHFSVIC